jgi:hypothetical protein
MVKIAKHSVHIYTVTQTVARGLLLEAGIVSSSKKTMAVEAAIILKKIVELLK